MRRVLMYDESFGAVMVASQLEATRLGDGAYGSEHVLLGLLAAAGPLAGAAQQAAPRLTIDAVRSAVRRGADDLPHLSRLGIDAQRVLAGVPDVEGPPSAALPAPRNRHAPEWQQALNTASVKLDHLQKSGALPRERTVSSAVLWLGVLERDTRAHRLLDAMGLDAEGIRVAVLAHLAGADGVAPVWPEQVRVGLLTRIAQWAFTRVNTAG